MEILDKLPSANKQPMLCNSQVLNKDTSVHTGTDLNWNPEKLWSIFVWLDSSLTRPCDRQMAADIMPVACVAPASSLKSLCLMLQGQHFQNNNRPTV